MTYILKYMNKTFILSIDCSTIDNLSKVFHVRKIKRDLDTKLSKPPFFSSERWGNDKILPNGKQHTEIWIGQKVKRN